MSTIVQNIDFTSYVTTTLLSKTITENKLNRLLKTRACSLLTPKNNCSDPLAHGMLLHTPSSLCSLAESCGRRSQRMRFSLTTRAPLLPIDHITSVLRALSTPIFSAFRFHDNLPRKGICCHLVSNLRIFRMFFPSSAHSTM